MVTVLYSITIFAALSGNLLLIFIVTRRTEARTLTGFLFVNMAAADLLVTLIVMPVSMATPYTESEWLPDTIGDITCKTVFYIGYHVTIVASIFSLTLMSVDRYLGVAYPLHRFPHFRRAKVLTAVIWLTSMIVMIPAAVLWKIEKPNPDKDAMYCQPAFGQFEDFADNKTVMKFFYTYLFIVCYIIPLFVISVLYGLVCRKLWFQKMPGERLMSSAIDERRHQTAKKIVRTLVIVTAAFALCWLPPQAYHLIFAFDYECHQHLPRYIMFLCFWSGHANSAVNPWLYMLLSGKYRLALRDVVQGGYSNFRASARSPHRETYV